VLGLFDVASKTGLTKHQEDFGQTLAVWGLDSGPYLMLPFVGPSTLRDTPGRAVDYYTYPLAYVSHDLTRIELTGLYYLDLRSYLLYAEDAIGTQFFDPYAVLRDAYLERRAILIADGKGMEHPEDDDELINELEALED
jgi:phospholipid-binding lipoprotein MlaA